MGNISTMWLNSFFTVGIFQLLFILSIAIGSRRKDYTGYAIYLVSLLAYSVGLCENYYKVNLLPVNAPFFHQLLDKPMVFFSYMLYFRFGRFFLDTAKINAAFDRLIRKSEWLLLIFSIVQVFFILFASAALTEIVFQLISLFVIPFTIYSVIRFIRLQKTTLNYFFITGVASVLIGSLGTFLIISLQNAGMITRAFPAPAFFLFSAVVESFVFSLGLIYKLLYTEKEKNNLQAKLIDELNMKYEIQQKLKEYTSELTQNMHDHIGATFTNISLLSRIPSQDHNIERIKKSNLLIERLANDATAELKDTLWLIRRKAHENLDSIIEKLLSHYQSSFSARGLKLQISRSENLQEQRLSILQEKHLYLIAREAITNTLKYSNGTCLSIRFERKDRLFCMAVNDDGICKEEVQFYRDKGNGIDHFYERTKQLQGTINFTHPKQFIFQICFELI